MEAMAIALTLSGGLGSLAIGGSHFATVPPRTHVDDDT
jgi:hypothetical protein